MPYKNFDLQGAELVAELAHGAPLRTNRLITALEEFVCGGAATLVAASGIPGARVEVYLTPPRYVLRVVSDAAALVVVDEGTRTVTLIEVIEEYVEATAQDWVDIVERAERALMFRQV